MCLYIRKNSDDDDDEDDAEIRSHFLASSNAVSGVRECADYEIWRSCAIEGRVQRRLWSISSKRR